MSGSSSPITKPPLTRKNLLLWFSLPLLLVFPVLIDLTNGFILLQLKKDFSVGVLFRGGMTFALLFAVFLIKQRAYQLYLFSLVALWSAFNVIWLTLGSEYSPVNEGMQLFRIFYQFVIVAYFIFLAERFQMPLQQMMKYLVWFAFIAGLSLIFSFITGVGVTTYGDYGYGMASFFKAQNDIGLAILICFPMAMYRLFQRFNLIRLVQVIVIILSLFILSTRAGILGSVGTVVLFMFSLLFYGRRNVGMSGLTKGIVFSFFFVGFCIGLYLYIDFIRDYPYLIQKYLDLMEGDARGNLTAIAENRLDRRWLVLNIFGEGDLSFHRHIEYLRYNTWGKLPHGREVEHDVFDFIGSYGWILGGLFLAFPAFCLVRMSWLFFLKRSLLNLTFLCAIALFLIHSFTAGHAIGSPTVASCIALVYFYILRYRDFNPKPVISA